MSDADHTYEDQAHERTPLPDAEADAYRARREALHAAVTDLDRFLDGVDVPEPEQVQAALRDFLAAVQEHVTEADAPNGLLASIIATAPWLGNRARQLRDEHDRLLADATSLALRAQDGTVDAALLDDMRDLSARVSEHRHRGTGLVLDAYMLDIPAGD
jgi:hypothetical protein